MAKEYIITEEQRISIIASLDRLPGTRQLANFFEHQLSMQAHINQNNNRAEGTEFESKEVAEDKSGKIKKNNKK